MLALIVCTALAVVFAAAGRFVGNTVKTDGAYPALISAIEDENEKNPEAGLDVLLERLRSDEVRRLFDDISKVINDAENGFAAVIIFPTILLFAGYLLIYRDAAGHGPDEMTGRGFAAVKIVMILKFAAGIISAMFVFAVCAALSIGVDRLTENYAANGSDAARIISIAKSAAITAVVIFAAGYFVLLFIYQIKFIKFFGRLRNITIGRQVGLRVPTYVIVINYIYVAAAGLGSLGSLASGNYFSALASASSAVSMVMLSILMSDLKNNASAAIN